MNSILENGKIIRVENHRETRAWKDSSLCLETSTENAVQEFHLQNGSKLTCRRQMKRKVPDSGSKVPCWADGLPRLLLDKKKYKNLAVQTFWTKISTEFAYFMYPVQFWLFVVHWSRLKGQKTEVDPYGTVQTWRIGLPGSGSATLLVPWYRSLSLNLLSLICGTFAIPDERRGGNLEERTGGPPLFCVLVSPYPCPASSPPSRLGQYENNQSIVVACALCGNSAEFMTGQLECCSPFKGTVAWDGFLS